MALPLAVSDTSVLINLHHLDLLPSLSLFYREVLVPAPVRVEFLRRDDQRSREVALNILTIRGLFSPCDYFDTPQVELYRLEKMKGAEAEALSQLHIRSADVLLIDERIGRKIATREMRKVHGTASILARLHINGITDYWSSINVLRSESGFWITEQDARRSFDIEMSRRDTH